MHVCTYLCRISSIWILVSKVFSTNNQGFFSLWAGNVQVSLEHLAPECREEHSQWLEKARSDPIWHYLNIKENNDSN